MTQWFRSRRFIRTTGDLKSSPDLVFLLLEGFHLGSIAHSLYPVHYREPPGQNVTKTGSFQGINIYPRQNYQMHYCCRYWKIILLLAYHFDFEKLEHNFILIHVLEDLMDLNLPQSFYLTKNHSTSTPNTEPWNAKKCLVCGPVTSGLNTLTPRGMAAAYLRTIRMTRTVTMTTKFITATTPVTRPSPSPT